MQDSIFTKIIKGEIPCHKVYEDDKTFAFLDIHPIHPGHVLVVPKKQVDLLWDLDDTDYQAVMATAKKVAKRIKEVLRPVRVGVHVAGLEVPHVHIHLFPFSSNEDFWTRPDSSAEPDHAALAEMAKKLAF
ncbi:MAG TPA: HIT family protein [Candidatus Saccharimonadales bacterium]